MYELIQAGPRSYYIDCPAKIGLFLQDDGRAVLIDSGSDKDAGRRVRKLLDQNGWALAAILNTHSNADHIGGNHYLQQQYGCPIFAPGIEAAFTRWPILEPAFLYGGYPFAELRHKFLMAAPSEAQELSAPGFPQKVEVLPLPGHFFDMVGYRTPDGTVFLADCLSSQATLEKYQLSFLYDVQSYLDTLDRVSGLEAGLFVPAHAEATADIRPLAAVNRAKVLDIADQLCDICRTPLPFDSILQRVFDRFGLTMTYEQHVLIGSTVRSYLSWLKDQGRVACGIENNLLLWRA